MSISKPTRTSGKATPRRKPSKQPASVFQLSPSEKLQLVEDLWDDLAATPDDVPIPEWRKVELDRRTANLEKHPAPGASWEEAKRRVRARHGR